MRRREGALRPDRARRPTVKQRRVSGTGLKMAKVLKVLKVLNF
jgi:hypothetical protein